jgi:PAS domain S-box-containing protein
MGYILLTGGGFILMSVIAAPPAGYGYYVGIIISLMFGYTLIRERFIYAAPAGAILLVAYLAVSLAATSIPINLLFHNGLYLFTTNILGMLIAYFLEFSARRDFFLGNMLSLEKAEVQRLNVRLEEKVARRTRALSTANAALQREIGEREAVESALREERARLKILFDFAPDGCCMIDLRGEILEINRAAEAIAGYTREELSGRNILKLDLLTPDDQLRVGAVRRTNRAGKAWGPGEFTITRKDGASTVIEVHTHPVVINNQRRVLIMLRDITERKSQARARQRLEKQLAQAQKMEAVGTLAGGIAHDFNNILSAIIGYTELSQLDAPMDGTLHENLNQIQTAGLRAKDLIQQILTFSRHHDIEIIPVQAGAVFKESLKLLRASIPTTIEIRPNIASEAFTLANPTQLQQILMNLCTNAAHAMGMDGGILEVTLTDTVIDSSPAHREINLPPGAYIQLKVSDTGCGMAPGVIRRIFDPYFTTKEKGEGSGLGMAVVHGIVSRYRGGITIFSEEGRGTTVNVYLTRQPQAGLNRKGRSEVLLRGSEQILLVDDEPQLVTIGQQMLARLGYRVTATDDSLEALEIFRAQPEAFAVVITDMAMPKMSGIELSRAVRAIRPETPVILCTGHSAGLTREDAFLEGVRHVLMKPIRMQALAARVRQVIDGDQMSFR